MTTRWEKTAVHDDPELVGAQWWRTAVEQGGEGTSRRSALLSLAGLAAAGMTIGGAVGSTGCGGTSTPEEIELTKRALDLQKEFGWDVGSTGKMIGYPPDVTVGEIADPVVLDTLVERLQPTNPAHAPFYLPVLFQSLTATPTTPPGTPGQQLRDLLRPIDSPPMQDALSGGRGLASLFDSAPPGRAVVVDMPGLTSVAFATGLADRFDPIFVFDNWPHPVGVVDSHLTLAALLQMLPELEEAAAARPTTAPPMFVLDANRLAPFDESGSRFDNRYLAVLPSASQLRTLGISEILYVRPHATDHELDDLNADFVEWKEAGIEVRLVTADKFKPPQATDQPPAADPSAPPPAESNAYHTSRVHTSHHWYGSPLTHWFFWHHYGWGAPRYRTADPGFAAPTWTAKSRPPMFSTPSGVKRAPSSFGSVSVKQKAGSSPSLTPRSSSSRTSTGTFGRGSGGRSGA